MLWRRIVILLVIVLLIFGAKRLPELGSGLGGGLRGFGRGIRGDDEEPAAIEQPRGSADAEATTRASGRSLS